MVAAHVQRAGLLALDVERRVCLGLGAGRWVEHRQIQVFQASRALAFEAHVVKVPVHQTELLVDAQIQNPLGVGGKANRGGAACGAVAKLDDAVAALVAGARVHAVALHQRHAGKVVGRKAVLIRHLQNFVVDRCFVSRRNKAFGHRAVHGFFQHRMGGSCQPGTAAWGSGAGAGRRCEIARTHVVGQRRAAQRRNRAGQALCGGCALQCGALRADAGPLRRLHRLHRLQFGAQGAERQGLTGIHQVRVANLVCAGQFLRKPQLLLAIQLESLCLGLLAHDANQRVPVPYGVARGGAGCCRPWGVCAGAGLRARLCLL